MAREIISGDPGTTWTNDTGKARYQFICLMINTCGFCLQYHLKISQSWGIPLHFECHCMQRMIKPEQQAPYPFCDYRELLDKMPPDQQRAAIGASSYKLLKSGLATWEDIVTPSRVRDFREVVAKKRLTVDQMVKHGVKPLQAQRAYSAVHTEEHEHVERRRQELLQKITGAGLSQEHLVQELGNRLAARVSIAAGPTGAEVGRPQDGTAPAWSGGRLPVAAAATAAELGRLIAGWKPKGQSAALRKMIANPPDTVVVIERDGDKLKMSFGGKAVAIGPGESAFGRTYEEWQKVETERETITARRAKQKYSPPQIEPGEEELRARSGEIGKRQGKAIPPPVLPAPPLIPLPASQPAALPPTAASVKPTAERTFANYQEGEKWGQENYKQWARKLPAREKDAISRYVGNDWYSPLNRWLRNDRGPTGDMRGRTITELQAITKDLDKALARNPLKENLVVHRVIDFKRVGKSVNDFKPDSIIDDKGFASCTLNPAPQFRGTVLKIHLPKGTHAAYLNPLGEDVIPTKTERELLVGRNVNQYRVISVKKSTVLGQPDIVEVEGILSEQPHD